MKESYSSYVRRWNVWRKSNMNGKFYKFLVLIKVLKSPTMALTVPVELPKRRTSHKV